jgi:molybdopterin/thiamine biosynthesis adenylyltransferase
MPDFQHNLPALYFCKRRAAQAAAATLQAMNPLVKVNAAAGTTEAAAAAAALADALSGQDLVIATGLPLGQLQQLNAAARQAGANFMAGGAGGPGGWFFVDLRQHTYVPKVSQIWDNMQQTYVRNSGGKCMAIWCHRMQRSFMHWCMCVVVRLVLCGPAAAHLRAQEDKAMYLYAVGFGLMGGGCLGNLF